MLIKLSSANYINISPKKRESVIKTAAQKSQLRPGEKEENLELDNYKSELRKNRSYGRKVGGAIGALAGTALGIHKTKDPITGIFMGTTFGTGAGAVAGDGISHLYTAGKHLIRKRK